MKFFLQSSSRERIAAHSENDENKKVMVLSEEQGINVTHLLFHFDTTEEPAVYEKLLRREKKYGEYRSELEKQKEEVELEHEGSRLYTIASRMGSRVSTLRPSYIGAGGGGRNTTLFRFDERNRTSFVE